MTDSHTLIARIQTALDKAKNPSPGRISLSLPLTGSLTGAALHSLPQINDKRHFWGRPDSGDYWLGLGCAWQSLQEGSSRLVALAADARRLSATLTHLDPEGCHTPPRLSLDSDHHSGRLSLPVLQFCQHRGSTTLTVTPDPERPGGWRRLLESSLSALFTTTAPLPGPLRLSHRQQTPDASVWLDLADQALDALKRTSLQKLVLTRQIRFQAERELSIPRLLQTLIYQQSGCTLFALDRDDGCWLGASPEILLDQNQTRMLSQAVAGTVRRDPCETVDDKLGQWLLQDEKNRHEHQLVVKALASELAPLCRELTLPPSPHLLKLRGLQHLYTPLAGTLATPLHPLEIAQRLHPSPAICGYPRIAAQAWLKHNEPLDRRLFTGLTGWIDTQADAALNVALRCTCIKGRQVDLFAGAGLVAGSRALSEWEETELKLDNMTQALQEA